MSKQPERPLIVGLDIGTSKVLAIVAEIDESDKIEIVGVGHHPAKGLRRGVVADIESTVKSISRAVEEAELMAECKIYSVYVGIAGSHVNSLNSNGVAAISEGGVTRNDINQALESAEAMMIPADQKILHVVPQEYTIDKQSEIRDPLGMSGKRLEANVHMITGDESSVENIVKCVQRCDLEVDELILEQLASSEAVLTDDERELGVCMVDVGGGTSDIAVFQNGAIRHTAVIPIAGDQVTNDIAVAMQTPTQSADEIKKKYGCALAATVGDDDMIEVNSVDGKQSQRLSRKFLAEVIESRLEEIFLLVQSELRHAGMEDAVTSVVITGGSSMIESAVELAADVFNMPVRLGTPNYYGGLSEMVTHPMYATGTGLIRMGHRMRKEPQMFVRRKEKKSGGALKRLVAWFKKSF